MDTSKRNPQAGFLHLDNLSAVEWQALVEICEYALNDKKNNQVALTMANNILSMLVPNTFRHGS